MPDLSNCPNCGKVYVKALRSVCDACAREVEKKFDTVYRFIRKRENRTASMEEVHEGTEVEKNLIVQFIREGRLQITQFPNLRYPCEKCGEPVREGRICGKCRNEITRDLQSDERQKAFEKRKEKQNQSKYRTYHSLDDRVKRGR